MLEQLRRGARYLDIRVGGKKNSTLVDDTIIVHGILKGAPFPNILEEIDQFLTDNPREFLIIEIITDKNKHGMSNQQLHDVLQLITSTFNDMIITQEDLDSWFKLNSVTLGQLSEEKKNALILINDGWTNFTHDGKYYDFSTIAKDFRCHNHARYMKNKWHNTKCAQTLLQSNESFLANGCNECDKFMNNQFVMTPQPPEGVGDAIAMLLGVTSLRPVSLARELYRKDYLETFIRDNADNRWNIVLLDFIDLCPLLIRFLIGLNSSKQLKFKEAFVKSKDGSIKLDRTDIVNKLKRRSSSLYLLDFKKDLDLSADEGTLHLKAQFLGEDFVDHIIPFNKDTEYLLCDM